MGGVLRDGEHLLVRVPGVETPHRMEVRSVTALVQARDPQGDEGLERLRAKPLASWAACIPAMPFRSSGQWPRTKVVVMVLPADCFCFS